MSRVARARSMKTATKEAAKYNADSYVIGMQEPSVTLNQQIIRLLWKWEC